MRRYHELKRDWGFPQLISLDTFQEDSNGYLVDDSCTFGAEVFILKHSGKWESLTMIKEPRHNTYTWTLNRYSGRDKSFYYSDHFSIGGKNWYILFLLPLRTDPYLLMLDFEN